MTLAAVVAAFAAAAAPANADVTSVAAAKPPATLVGECSFDGDAQFGETIQATPVDMDWSFRATGTCTGVVNGERVENTPASWSIDAHGPVSCTAGYSLEGRFQITFADVPGDKKLTGDLKLVQTFSNNLHLEGDHLGYAEGQSTFFQNGAFETMLRCAEGTSITTLKATNSFVTVGPLSG